MNFIVINSSQNKLCLYLFLNNKIFYKEELNQKSISEAIIVLIDDILKEASVSLSQLHFIGVIKGPGSYTGLRIGISAANALSFALNKIVVGISRFEAIFASLKSEYKNNSQSIVILDNNKGGFFIQVFQNNLEDSKPFSLDENEFIDYLKKEALNNKTINVIGDGVKKLQKMYFNDFKNINLYLDYNEINLQSLQEIFINKYLYLLKNNIINIPIAALYVKEPNITIKHNSK